MSAYFMDDPIERTTGEPQKIRFKRITAGSLFSLIVTAVFSFFVPLILLGGFLAFFGVRSIGFGAIHLTFRKVGLPGLLNAPIAAPTFSLVVSVAVWMVLYCGMFIWSISGSTTIAYVPIERSKS